MIRIVLGLILTIAVFWLFAYVRKWWQQRPEGELPKFGKKILFWLAAGGIILLTVTGKLNALIGLVGTVLLLLSRAQGVLQTIATIRRLFGKSKGDSQREQRASPARSEMTVQQACEVLDVKIGASQSEIQEAYRRLISKVHPDRGGSTYFAEQLNQARDVLMKQNAQAKRGR